MEIKTSTFTLPHGHGMLTLENLDPTIRPIYAQLDQLRLMLVGMVLAEQQFCTGGQLGANACSSAAPIAPISPG